MAKKRERKLTITQQIMQTAIEKLKKYLNKDEQSEMDRLRKEADEALNNRKKYANKFRNFLKKITIKTTPIIIIIPWIKSDNAVAKYPPKNK